MNRKGWIIPYSRPEVSEELLQAGYGPLLSAVLTMRGVGTAGEARRLIHGGADCLYDPLLLGGMSVARARVLQAIRLHEIVAVYGDYDVDGITATCLVTDYLRREGLDCIPYIPDRSEEGYGLNRNALDSLREEGVSLVITVDCGITAVDEAEYARSLGIDVIITDHHECKTGALPDAVAVIDCKMEGDPYPNPSLAGVGVALKLVSACNGDGEAMLGRYADLVAVGTVADVMPLVDENRYLVRRGIRKLTEDPLPGFSAMLREAGVDPAHLTASAIGFSLAPRLNAAGRLGQAVKAAELLMSSDENDAAALASELCELNRQRQNIETEIWQEAQALLADKQPDGPIVLASDRWHQGVIGIAASRLAEQFSLPAVMICLSGDQGKGSCRSYGGFNLYDALAACSEHLLGFGGHALAAGLTISADKIEVFRQALDSYYRANAPEEQPELRCDLLIRDPSLLSIDNVRELDLLEPYGNGNQKPVFCILNAELEAVSDVGGGRHMRIRARMGRARFEGIFFSHSSESLGLQEGDFADLAFTPQINDYRGHVSVQLVLCAVRRHAAEDLCARILQGDDDCLWAAADYRPERADFVRLWKSGCASLPLPQQLDEMLSLCPAGMAKESFCICLTAFLEAGLLQSETDSVFGASRAEIDGKADLDNTRIMRALRSFQTNLS